MIKLIKCCLTKYQHILKPDDCPKPGFCGCVAPNNPPPVELGFCCPNKPPPGVAAGVAAPKTPPPPPGVPNAVPVGLAEPNVEFPPPNPAVCPKLSENKDLQMQFKLYE